MRVYAFDPSFAGRFFEHLVKRVAGHRSAQPGQEHEPRSNRLSPAQFAETADLATAQRMNPILAMLGSLHPEVRDLEIDLRPLQAYKLGSPQTVAIAHQDHQSVAIGLRVPDNAL